MTDAETLASVKEWMEASIKIRGFRKDGETIIYMNWSKGYLECLKDLQKIIKDSS